MKRLFIAFFSALLLFATLVSASPVSAAACSSGSDPLACVCGQKGTSASTACGNNGSNPIAGSGGVLHKATLLIASVAGVAAVIVILVSGIIFVTASGNAQRTEQARNAIIGAVVGLVIIATASAVVIFVASRI